MTPNATQVLKTVDEMLLDAGQSHGAELRATLFSLASFAALPAPAPNAKLEALMWGSEDRPSEDRPALCLRLSRQRPAVIGLAVITGMGLGISSVAATAAVQGQHAGTSMQHLLEGWGPSWTVTGDPAASSADSLTDPPSLLEPSTSSGTGTAGVAGTPASANNPVSAPCPAAGVASGTEAASGTDAGPGTDAAQFPKLEESGVRESERAVDQAAQGAERARELLAGGRAEHSAAGKGPVLAVFVPALAAKTGAAKNANLDAMRLEKFGR